MKVIKILNECKIVVNYGSDNGAKVGQKLRIIQCYETIYDPDTKIKLGSIPINKAVIAIEEVYPFFCVCINGEKQDLFLIPRRLNVDVREISVGPPLLIKINDLVEADDM